MDFALTQLYRNIYNDISILRDACGIYFAIHPSGQRSFGDFAKGLDLVLLADHHPGPVCTWVWSSTEKMLVVSHEPDVEDDTEHSREDDTVLSILWGFYRSVVIEYSMEELSQYPFWAAKVIMCTSDSPIIDSSVSLGRSFFNLIRDRLAEGGIMGTYKGCLPFLGASLWYNFSHVEGIVRQYVVSSYPRVLSVHSFMQSKEEETAISKRTRSASIVVEPEIVDSSINSASNILSMESLSGAATRGALVLLSHPFLLLSVRQVTNAPLTMVASSASAPSSVAGIIALPFGLGYANGISSSVIMRALYDSWFVRALNIYATQGISGFFNGIRGALGAAFLPISSMLLLGITEMVTYRRMSSSTDMRHSASIVHDIVVNEGGYLALLKYGALTAYQILPGFFSFTVARSALWFIFGTSDERMKQYSRRDTLLRSFWGSPDSLANREKERPFTIGLGGQGHNPWPPVSEKSKKASKMDGLDKLAPPVPELKKKRGSVAPSSPKSNPLSDSLKNAESSKTKKDQLDGIKLSSPSRSKVSDFPITSDSGVPSVGGQEEGVKKTGKEPRSELNRVPSS